MRDVRVRIARCASRDVPVLVTGETGTGKELVARSVHLQSDRAREPFVAVNCAAIAAPLFESEVFGAQRGAYTGATRDRPGLVAAAGSGTLFLDEVGELALDAQAKLLRLLDAQHYRPVGDPREHRSQARIIAATNRDLCGEVEKGNFRRDLFYRLDVANIHMPALRERISDLPLLVDHFLERAADEFGHRKASRAALEALSLYEWPGNVRELEHVVTRTLMWDDAFEIEAFDVRVKQRPVEGRCAAGRAQLQWSEAVRVLRTHRGRLSPSAEQLGVSVRTLQRRMRELGMNARDFR
jgi:transcriptional regulator with PAS, ATPase and Fis domain